MRTKAFAFSLHVVLALIRLQATVVKQPDLLSLGGAFMSYTIEIRTASRGNIDCSVVGKFTDADWNSLWDELQIDHQQWQNWQTLVQSKRQGVPLLPDFPEVSKLAYIDEGTVQFTPKELHEECLRLIPIVSVELTRELIGKLLEASASAMRDETADLVVHPFPA